MHTSFNKFILVVNQNMHDDVNKTSDQTDCDPDYKRYDPFQKNFSMLTLYM